MVRCCAELVRPQHHWHLATTFMSLLWYKLRPCRPLPSVARHSTAHIACLPGWCYDIPLQHIPHVETIRHCQQALCPIGWVFFLQHTGPWLPWLSRGSRNMTSSNPQNRVLTHPNTSSPYSETTTRNGEAQFYCLSSSGKLSLGSTSVQYLHCEYIVLSPKLRITDQA